MAVVCSIDIVNEVFDLVPTWRKRYLLNIDLIIKLFKFVREDLWHPDLYKKVFNKDKEVTTSMSIADLNKEL